MFKVHSFDFRTGRSANESDWIFHVLFPFGEHQLIVSIGDRTDSVTQWTLPNVFVHHNLLNSIDQLLLYGNLNIVIQTIILISHQMNIRNAKPSNRSILKSNLFSWIENGISSSMIFVSPLQIFPAGKYSASDVHNDSSWDALTKVLNRQAEQREYLIGFFKRFQLNTSNSLKLQSTALIQLTSVTNELTRKTLVKGERNQLVSKVGRLWSRF